MSQNRGVHPELQHAQTIRLKVFVRVWRWGMRVLAWGCYLFILIGSDSNELCFREDVSPEGAVRELHYIIGSHNVESRLVFMHWVQYCLKKKTDRDRKKEILLANRCHNILVKSFWHVVCSSTTVSIIEFESVPLTKPCLSEMLLVSLSLWKATGLLIHCSPLDGLSGWMYIRFGISGSAFPATVQPEFWNL